MHVLLVEDHTDSRAVLTTLLNRCGRQTVSAKSIREARALLEKISFSVLLSDLSLPDGDGIDLVREAKQIQPQLKAIALTGRDSAEDRAAGMAAGFDCYLTKPVDYEELQRMLSEDGIKTSG